MNVLTKDERIQSVNNIRTYSREFLLNLQFTPFTIRKPVFITEENGVVFDVLVHDPEAEYHKSSTEFSDDDDESEYMMDTSDNNSRADRPPFRNRGRRPRGHRGGHVRGSVTANENGKPMYNIPIYQDGKEISRETPSNDRPPRGRGRGRGRNINSSERGKHQRHRSNSRQRRGSQDFQNNVDHFSERRRNSSSNVLETSETDNLPASDTEKKRHGRIFGYKLLKELSESDRSPDLLAFELLDTKGGFEELLNKEEMNPDWVILLLQILARIIGTQQKQTLIDLLNVLLTKRFLESQLIPLLNKISMNSVNVTDVSSFVHNAFTICKTALERLPEEFLPPCNLVLVLLQTIVQKNKDNDQTTSYTLAEDVHELELLLKAVGTGIEERKKAIENEAANRRQRHLVCEDLPPPDNFRELAILPAFGDLDFNQRPFLRVNKIEGSYDNLDHYLDVQFRLLREDYIQPLRKGILQYRVEKEHGKIKKIQDIRLYEKVHIVRSACSNDGILHVLQFDVSKMTKVRWESSKRLLYGSLVCLSPDDFETMYFATVTNRDTKELTNGFIQVRFQQNLEELREIGPTESFIMAETTAYFEAYRHTLRGLQQIDSSMPFQTYIVECQSTMKPPKYLLQHGKIIQYDFEPLVNGTKEFNCPVINTRRWPTASEMNLDESQYRALQLAVTKELAIIQGPPGTGKTHIGLKIAELLLHNTSVWNETKEIDPILIVCYTNHALDQFLEGILQFCTSVVRIGGRCNSAKLEPYKLSEFRMSARRSLPKKVTLTIQKRKSDCRRQMSKERDKIEETNTKLYTTRFGIMHESILKNYIQKKPLSFAVFWS
ncbi:hypothetical protein KUTeg_003557 [Tegillarca granosa]|uniref:NFX1-type zinc finger-containing protein 1 n=1 Tax=Tegillarca granosa TaxID=220873 RepID=A0ABQ9FP33_TEGGR|nr:hypothetical protein KUTeg_003557 [Tegillarca granosa]